MTTTWWTHGGRTTPGQVRRSGWRAVAGLLAAVLAVTLAEQPVLAAPEAGTPEPAWSPPEVAGVEVTDLGAGSAPNFAAADAVVTGERSVDWPAPANEWVTLPAGSVTAAGRADAAGAPAATQRGRVAAGGLPIRVGAAPSAASAADAGDGDELRRAEAATPARVRVSVADRAATERAGVRGLLVRVARDDGRRAAGRVAVEVDYSGFRHAYGGDWSSRLRIAMLPGCPEQPASGAGAGAGADAGAGAGTGCGVPVPLATARDHRAGTLAAAVPLPADGAAVTLAVAADESGDNGDYSATSLKPAATWQVSGQTGGFSWNYPLRMVPGVGGPEPNLSLAYSSQAVDGLTANTNTQGSWIGDGWDLWPGYIERQYRSCADDTDRQDGNEPNNKDKKTGDRCWFNHNATMSLNGQATELVHDGGGRYRGVTDDGSRIERLTDTGLGNGDDNGEYWKVTTTDGTQYFFGRHRRPAYPSDGAATNSTWTSRVYGNHPGEPCHRSGDFSGSGCTQAWRWNLDYVVDPHGNTMTLFYSRETGAYGRESDPDKRTTYHRGGYLTRIEYGTRRGSEHTAPVTARVLFDVADRCKPNATCTTGNPSAWPDTPWDRYCKAAPCTDQLAPTFWTQKRLAKIRSQVWRGSSFADVESWTLRHQYLDAGATDGEGVPMWLRGITRTGHVGTAGGTAVADPEVTFDPGGMPLANRVDGPSDGRTQLYRWRVRSIVTESGAQIGVGYSGRDCTRGNLPTPHTNGRRCMPQWYAPEGFEPTLDWFHKYVVTRVDVYDNTGASAHQQTNYDYLDDPAWHYDDSELVDRKKRTWGQWRGYSKVRVRKGLEGQGVESATNYLYLRGMHGDRAGPSGGTKNVQVTDSQGESITDHEAHAGFLREEIVRDGPGGSWVSGKIHDPWRHGPTATSGPLKAWLTDTGTTRTRTALAGGGTRWTRTVTTFDTTYGMPVRIDDLGDEATSADDKCVRHEYARNTSTWLVDKVSRTETVGVRCSVSPSRPADVLSDERTYYDNPDTFGATPTRGLAVRKQEVADWNGSTPVRVTTERTSYDANGRAVEVADALGRTTSTAYTPARNGPVTSTRATNELGHVVTSTMEPAWHLPTRTVDANGHRTELAYDGLGRLTEVWLPGRDRATQRGNSRFEYLVRNTAPSAVTTRKLLPTGNTYQTSITLFDGLLRQRQTQTQAPGGGRVVTDTVYDSRGLKEAESKEYYDTFNNPPSTTLVGVGQPQTPGITSYVHDGAERVTHEIYLVRGAEAWRTSYRYGGDRVHTTPPAGGTATTTITDARDQTTALRQYHGPTPTGSYDETRYTYTERGERASVTDPAGNTWTYTYDQRGRETQSTDPDKGTAVTSYDAAGQVSTVTDARGVTLGYTYDALGRRTSVREGSPTGAVRAEWTFDTLPNGIGKPARSIRHHGGLQYVSEVTGYDSAGRPTGTRIVVPAGETGLDGVYETTTEYRADGSTAASTLPAVGDLPAERMTYAYNDVGAPSWVVSPLTTYVNTVDYNKLGELVQRVLGPHGRRTAVTYQIDEATGRVVNAAAVPELRPEIMDLAYGYDDVGNLTRIADSPGSATPNDTQCYRYDHLRRLSAAWTPAAGGQDNCAADPSVAGVGGPATYWHSWTYDRTGNRLTQTAHAARSDTVTTYTHPPAGGARPHTVTAATTAGPDGTSLDTYGYDAVGNLDRRTIGGDTQTLDWDLEGNLRSVTDGDDVTSYVYDADGNRLIARDPGGGTLYLPGGAELRYDATSGTRAGIRYYSHIDTTVAVRTGQGLTWLVTDHHNTGEAAVRDSDLQVQRRRTLPFGGMRGSGPAWWAGDKGFVGGTLDRTGLTHIGAREYDPALGRFISVDPIIDVADPQQMHGYAYGNNAPPTVTDPDGLFGFKKLMDGARSVGNAVKSTAETVGGAVAQGAAAAGGAVADFAVDTYNHIKEDPLKFATEVAVGVAVGAVVAATCAAPPGIGCAVGVGIVAGAAAAAAGYGVDVAQGDREFSPRDLTTEMVVGGAIGGLTGGLGRALTPALKSIGGRLSTPFRKACNSFIPGTAVAMADGKLESIENVRIGDQVLATNPNTGETTAEDVTATITSHGTKVLVDVIVAEHRADTASGTVTATDNHPFWAANRDSSGRWVEAAALKPGDMLLAPDGSKVRVLAIVAYAATATVHNLTVATQHTYYVAAGNVNLLTHNDNRRCHLHPDGDGVDDFGQPCYFCNSRTQQPISSGVPHSVAEVRPESSLRAVSGFTSSMQGGDDLFTPGLWLAIAAARFTQWAATKAASAIRRSNRPNKGGGGGYNWFH